MVFYWIEDFNTPLTNNVEMDTSKQKAECGD